MKRWQVPSGDVSGSIKAIPATLNITKPHVSLLRGILITEIEMDGIIILLNLKLTGLRHLRGEIA